MELMIQQKLSKFFITKVYLEFGKRLDVCHYSNYFLYCAFALSSLLSTFYKINSWRLCIFVMYLKVRQ